MRDDNNYTKNKIIKTFEEIPFIDKIIKFIKIWKLNWKSFIIGMTIGATSLLFLVLSGKLPQFLVSKKYRRATIEITQPTKTRTKPRYVNIVSVEDPTNWLLPYGFWLEKEADDLKSEKLIKDYTVRLIVSEGLSQTPEFVWVLTASPGFKISGWAFREIIIDSLNFFEPLNAKKDAAISDSIRFTVPECETGYRLIAILRVYWTQDLTLINFQDTFHSNVE